MRRVVSYLVERRAKEEVDVFFASSFSIFKGITEVFSTHDALDSFVLAASHHNVEIRRVP